MTVQTLRRWSMKMGRCAMLLGALVSVAGLWIGNAPIIGFGCLMLFGGAYAVIFSHVGSF